MKTISSILISATLGAIVSMIVIFGFAINSNHQRDLCSQLSEYYPTHEFQITKTNECAVRINGLWVFADTLLVNPSTISQ